MAHSTIINIAKKGSIVLLLLCGVFTFGCTKKSASEVSVESNDSEVVPAQPVSSSRPQPIEKKNAKSQTDPNDPTIKKPQGGAAQPSEISPIKPKTVSLDALAIPAGWMGGSNPPTRFVQLSKASSCYSGSNCTEITYSTGGNWAGIVYWPPVCGESGTDQAWENVRSGACGINLIEKENFTDIERFSFWARGQGTIEFKVGAVDIPPIPGATTGKVTLSNSWKKYEIPLKAVDLNSSSGLFIWTAADLDNPDGAKFTIDKLQFEGQ